jgi:hypothetical protein
MTPRWNDHIRSSLLVSRRPLFLPVLLASTLTVSVAHAQTDSERGVARELWHEGDELQKAGRFADALEKYQGAQKLVAAPTNLVRIAQCEAAIGELVEAAETYRLAHRMPLPPDAPAALLKAQVQAQEELTQVEPRVPKLTLAITPPHPEQIEIVVDGRALNAVVAGEPIPLDPGAHRVLVRASGYRTFHRNIRLDDAEAKVLDVKLRTEAEGPEREAAPSEGSAASPQRTIGLVVGGVGVVAVVVGSVLGVVAKSTYGDATKYCPSGPTSPCYAQGLAEDGTAHGQATGSTVAFVAASALLAGGAALYFTAPRDRGVAVGMVVNGAGLGVRGSW